MKWSIAILGAILGAVLGAVVACKGKQEPSPGAVAPGEARIAAPADAVSSTDASLEEHMRAHFAVVSELQRSITRGQLEQARQHARWLVDHDDTMLAGSQAPHVAWRPRVDEMRAAAREVVSARDLPTAAVLAAKLARACSACHQQHAATIAFAWSEPPEDTPALAAQMKRHQWAAARLWEGLVGPSDEMWSQGAAVMATSRLDTALAGSNQSVAGVADLTEAIRTMATRATTEVQLDARATLYGELLSTCARCHALVRPAPVSGP